MRHRGEALALTRFHRRLAFTWPDQNKRLVSLPAPTYIDYVMSWVQKLLDDESIFPTKSGGCPCVAPRSSPG